MKRTPVRLADGRELIYFDRDETADRSAPDTRDLPERSAGGELRYDALLDEWVTVADHRQGRTLLPATEDCPLCPSRPGRATEIPAADYEVAVFENRFPAFAGQRGRAEVVCFTADHGASFAELPPEQAATVVAAWADRTAELSALPHVAQVFCFENFGEEIGVTLHHPHGQIFGYPFVPPRTRKMLDAARRYAERAGRDLFADVLAAERESGERVVAANELWTAFVPVAARWPFEVHLFPHRKVPDIAALTETERAAFVAVYLDVQGRFRSLFDRPLPYVAAWHQAPVRVDRELGHLHLQLFSSRRAADKLKYLAGSESGMDAFLNDVRPERAARMLREAG
ncbi:MAG TPA: galactose-1-phosphate uridylyltransferase [Actinophytocola sp.]|uniref:galactose-1-phosphate uridylyltransferase n=1 Tax=Actinophytocola sp. TaxID=1872138 RepID=UPI002DB8B9F5|nr:galactose-1-phosphate uridylyltransferase [Actinophytocola sp.]HEU5473041.1 galactose-1-phosphate uridylyltransferase [Actinophytocola sp.]